MQKERTLMREACSGEALTTLFRSPHTLFHVFGLSMQCLLSGRCKSTWIHCESRRTNVEPLLAIAIH